MLGDVALLYAKKGLPVFPCVPGDKRPATEHGCKDATTNANQIEEWWRAEPQANIGLASGAPSKIFCVDIDGFDGESSLRMLEREHGELPETVTSITGKGRHAFFKMPVGMDMRCSTSRLGENLDVRANGGYVVLPSTHPSGKKYCWSVDSASAFADPPAWLLAAILERAAKSCAPEDWRALVCNPIVEGTRDTTLARLAGLLLRRYVDARVALELVLAVNARRCVPPLCERDVARIVDSIAGIELRRRGRHGG